MVSGDIHMDDDAIVAVDAAMRKLGEGQPGVVSEMFVEVGRDAVRTYLANLPPAEFPVNLPVTKMGGDYSFEGIVVAAFQKRSGAWRYVVEDDRGLLLIHSAKTLHPKSKGHDEKSSFHDGTTEL